MKTRGNVIGPSVRWVLYLGYNLTDKILKNKLLKRLEMLQKYRSHKSLEIKDSNYTVEVKYLR